MNFVFSTSNVQRYKFPTHINDLVIDRSQTHHSEVFIVVLEPGQAPPLHKHDDMEQVFYILAGEGTLTIGKEERKYPVNPGDVVLIPPSTLHSIKAKGDRVLRYLAIDCFGFERSKDEPTWDGHVKVLCREHGWDYKKVISSST